MDIEVYQTERERRSVKTSRHIQLLLERNPTTRQYTIGQDERGNGYVGLSSSSSCDAFPRSPSNSRTPTGIVATAGPPKERRSRHALQPGTARTATWTTFLCRCRIRSTSSKATAMQLSSSERPIRTGSVTQKCGIDVQAGRPICAGRLSTLFRLTLPLSRRLPCRPTSVP